MNHHLPLCHDTLEAIGGEKLPCWVVEAVIGELVDTIGIAATVTSPNPLVEFAAITARAELAYIQRRANEIHAGRRQPSP